MRILKIVKSMLSLSVVWKTLCVTGMPEAKQRRMTEIVINILKILYCYPLFWDVLKSPEKSLKTFASS